MGKGDTFWLIIYSCTHRRNSISRRRLSNLSRGPVVFVRILAADSIAFRAREDIKDAKECCEER